MPKTKLELENLQFKLGYQFKNAELLKQALTHRSISRKATENNERMEFLGDAVLQLTVSDYLYHKFKKLPEGELAKARSLLVREAAVADVARSLDLNYYLKVGRQESLAKAQERNSLLCDVMEAVLGAIYLDGGFSEAQNVILKHLPDWDRGEMELLDAKSTLQEYCQQIAKRPPRYTLKREEGPDHKKTFLIEVSFQGEILGVGKGFSKKEAEQEAARNALIKLGNMSSELG